MHLGIHAEGPFSLLYIYVRANPSTSRCKSKGGGGSSIVLRNIISLSRLLSALSVHNCTYIRACVIRINRVCEAMYLYLIVYASLGYTSEAKCVLYTNIWQRVPATPECILLSPVYARVYV